MRIRKSTLWKVPVYCAAAGLIWFRLIIYVLGRFTMATLPDGSITVDETKQLIMYGVIFAVTFLIGGLLFRRMTRREIFCSATIFVVFHLLVVLLERLLQPTPEPLILVFLYLAEFFEWSSFLQLLLYRAAGDLWIGAVLSALAPYLFVLFGVDDSIESDF